MYSDRKMRPLQTGDTKMSSSLTLEAPIAKCGVLYLGSVVPRHNLVGLESIQEPLSKRYPTDNTNSVQGIDAVLMVRENGLEMFFVHDPTISMFYPIESLVYCASVRFATLPQDHNAESSEMAWPFKTARWGFMPLDSPITHLAESQHHPPLFCSVFKRTRNVAADECHCFITKTKESAMVLVQACFTAFSKQQKLNPKNFHSNCLVGKVIPAYIKATSSSKEHGSVRKNGSEPLRYEVDNANIKVIEAPTSNPIVDFMTNPGGDGFFYTSTNAVIDNWQLWEERNLSDFDKTRPLSLTPDYFLRKQK